FFKEWAGSSDEPPAMNVDRSGATSSSDRFERPAAAAPRSGPSTHRQSRASTARYRVAPRYHEVGLQKEGRIPPRRGPAGFPPPSVAGETRATGFRLRAQGTRRASAPYRPG